MLFKFKYPKLTLLILAVILAYLIFRNPNVDDFVSGLGSLSYLGVFIAGFLFSFGFTAPFSVGFFLTLDYSNLVSNGLIGALGAMISNMIIFGLVRVSFKQEIFALKKEIKRDIKKVRLMKETEGLISNAIGSKIKYYLIYVFIGIIIASPLPNEVGDALLAGMRKVNLLVLALLSFVLSFIGIVVLLLI